MSEVIVSVIIISWNNTAHLLRCLDALNSETYKNFEVIIVDNGSTDSLVDNIQQHDLSVRMERLETNTGFAVANNIGAYLAQGRWLALLNADAYPEPDWLENLVKSADENPEFSFFSSRQIQANDRQLLDGAGDAYHVSGLAWRRYYNRRAESYGLQPAEVFSACGAAALYLRADFLQVSGFDEDYFSYFEDVDLGFRLRLMGKKCLYIPQAVVYHVGSASTGKRSDFSVYYGYRNMIWTFVKNMPSSLIWLYLPLHIGTLLFFAVYLTFKGQGRAIWRAIFDAYRHLPKIIAKRQMIHQNLKNKPSDLLRVMSTGLFEPYVEFMRRNRRK
ncbi:MAG: glycosyltransferase family 2 protein [Anaerolineales bacterium]